MPRASSSIHPLLARFRRARYQGLLKSTTPYISARGIASTSTPTTPLLKPVPILDPLLKKWNITVSPSLTSPGHTMAMLDYLASPSNPTSACSILDQAGHIAIDLEGMLTPPLVSRYGVADTTSIRTVQIAIPLASLPLLPVSRLLIDELPELGTPLPVHVFIIDLSDPNLSTSDQISMMNHLTQIVNHPKVITLIHDKHGDQSALQAQFRITLKPPIIDTQIMFMQWAALAQRVKYSYAAIREHVPDIPALNPMFFPSELATTFPPKNSFGKKFPISPAAAGTAVFPKVSLYPSAIHLPEWEALNNEGSGLNDILTACHLPTNPLKNKSHNTQTVAARVRYAIWDVAFLNQAFWYMNCATAYLSTHICSFQSLSLAPELSSSPRVKDLWASPLSPITRKIRTNDNSYDERALVYTVFRLVTAFQEPVVHPGHLVPPNGSPVMGANLNTLHSSFDQMSSPQTRTYLNLRTGGIKRVIRDYPDVFQMYCLGGPLDPQIGPLVIWVSVVREPPVPGPEL